MMLNNDAFHLGLESRRKWFNAMQFVCCLFLKILIIIVLIPLGLEKDHCPFGPEHEFENRMEILLPFGDKKKEEYSCLISWALPGGYGPELHLQRWQDSC